MSGLCLATIAGQTPIGGNLGSLEDGRSGEGSFFVLRKLYTINPKEEASLVS